jgi:hypothetical protein
MLVAREAVVAVPMPLPRIWLMPMAAETSVKVPPPLL